MMTANAGSLIETMEPVYPGLRFRPYHGPDDLPGMAAANQAMRDADGILDTTSADDMAIQYANLTNSDLDRDVLIVERIDEPAGIVGYARVEWRDLTDGTRAFGSIILMDPQVRTAELARAMVTWSEAQIAHNARFLPHSDRVAVMQAYTIGEDPTLPDALRAAGWTLQGRGYEMLREPLEDPPATLVPEGLQFRPLVDDEETRRAIFETMADAFRDHRSEPEASEEDWRQFRDDPKYDPALWIIAFDGDEMAGGAIGLIDKDLIRHHGVQRGYVDGVFTRRAWRRRGLARAAVARVLVGLRERGMTSAFLEVDGLNPNQAMGLYESLGFAIVTTSADWSKPLPADREKDPRA